jgi:hypothetical protein
LHGAGEVCRPALRPDQAAAWVLILCAGEALVELPAEALASDARRGENAAIRAHALAEAERGQHMKQATTDQFQCGKCKQRKTQYYQMQARAPFMTPFNLLFASTPFFSGPLSSAASAGSARRSTTRCRRGRISSYPPHASFSSTPLSQGH